MPVEGPPILEPPPIVGVGISRPHMRGIEVSVPFRFGAGGEVITTTDPDVQVRQHVDALMRTIPGERVMKPTYGVSLLPYVFENITPADLAAMQQLIDDGFTTWIPSARLTKLASVNGPIQGVTPDTVVISLEYTRTADPRQSTATTDIPVVSI